MEKENNKKNLGLGVALGIVLIALLVLLVLLGIYYGMTLKSKEPTTNKNSNNSEVKNSEEPIDSDPNEEINFVNDTHRLVYEKFKRVSWEGDMEYAINCRQDKIYEKDFQLTDEFKECIAIYDAMPEEMPEQMEQKEIINGNESLVYESSYKFDDVNKSLFDLFNYKTDPEHLKVQKEDQIACPTYSLINDTIYVSHACGGFSGYGISLLDVKYEENNNEYYIYETFAHYYEGKLYSDSISDNYIATFEDYKKTDSMLNKFHVNKYTFKKADNNIYLDSIEMVK